MAIPTALATPWPSGPVVASTPGRHAELGVARRARAPLAEALQVVEREVVAGQVEERVEEHRGVAGREHEPVAVRPVGMGGGVAQEAGPERVRHGRHAHRRTGMPRVRLLDAVDGEGPDRVDRELVQLIRGEGGHRGRLPWWGGGKWGHCRARGRAGTVGRVPAPRGRPTRGIAAASPAHARPMATPSAADRCRGVSSADGDPAPAPRRPLAPRASAGPRAARAAPRRRARRPRPGRRPGAGAPARARHGRAWRGATPPGRLGREHRALADAARRTHHAHLRRRAGRAGTGARRRPPSGRGHGSRRSAGRRPDCPDRDARRRRRRTQLRGRPRGGRSPGPGRRSAGVVRRGCGPAPPRVLAPGIAARRRDRACHRAGTGCGRDDHG